MTTEPGSEPEPRSKGLLWAVVLLLLAAGGLLWGSSAVLWAGQKYRTSFGAEITAGVTGGDVRPELVPMALAALTAVAALLATGGWLRRIVGVLIAAAGGVLIWRAFQVYSFTVFGAPDGVPPGSTPVGPLDPQPLGPLMLIAGAVLLLVAGVLVVLRAGRMPAMGAKYSAPGAEKKKSHDPDRQMWQDLDAGRDPTDDQDR
ncbi:Trp biosynthesis-associated membrane protein [Saccharopolyspora oryzae]|uniref:Trp biosynthesis-associated membrane protein n=1 Tax=Saccharopolyspora oryzae TaxID=2997343 RepID=A0ABT4US39_9PSEU|nr:Trp biosynthesis-associated membrane protein [Saccharopolyspora oryzae]MDA3624530.1 Trp biosynthesis-associated membrane protein [Saccharopolyspora oryzae]